MNTEDLFRIPGASALWIATELSQTIFGSASQSVRGGFDLSEGVLAHFACISEPHLSDNAVHKGLVTSGDKVAAIRPTNYGRAAIVILNDMAFDLKGVGVRPGRIPSLAAYQTGLLPLPIAISEIFTQKLIDRLLLKSGNPSTLPCQALIELPFSAPDREGATQEFPQAILVRPYWPRNYSASKGRSASDDLETKFSLEMALRRFGVTSCSPSKRVFVANTSQGLKAHTEDSRVPPPVLEGICEFCSSHRISPPATFDITNIQTCFDPRTGASRLVDFEHFRYEKTFRNHVAAVAAAGEHAYFEVISPNSSVFIRRRTTAIPAVRLLEVGDFTCNGQEMRAKRISFVISSFLSTNPSLDKKRKFIHDLVEIASGRKQYRF